MNVANCQSVDVLHLISKCSLQILRLCSLHEPDLRVLTFIAAVLKCIPTCSQIYSLDEFSLPDKLCFSFIKKNVIYVAEFLFR